MGDTRVARRRSERTARSAGLIAAVSLHALAFALWPAVSIHVAGDPAAPRTLTGEPIRLVGARPTPHPPPPAASGRPIPSIATPVVPIVDARPARPAPDLRFAEAAPRRWSIPLPPVTTGTAGTEEGDGFVRPQALSILTEWQPRAVLHGIEILVRVHTSAAGRATGLVELVPPTPSPDMNREIVTMVRRIAYRPALRDGRPVSAWADITLVFCRTGVTATSPASPTGLEHPCPEEPPPPSDADGGV